MKKLILSLSMLTSIAMAQTMLPDVIAPTGWVHPMPQAKITASDYMEAEAGITFVADGNAAHVTVTASAAMSGGLKFFPFDASTETALQLPVDISGNKKVYLKMKGTLGDYIRLDLKNGPNYDFRNGYEIRQKILCEEYRWYEYDFSGLTTAMDDIREVFISHNPDAQGAGEYWIDSLAMGELNFTPVIPPSIDPFVFTANFTNDYYKFAAEDNTFSVANGEMTINYASTTAIGIGGGISINSGSAEKTIDITQNPIVKVSAKGTPGDTLRVNLKNGSNYEFIDGYSLIQILTADFKEYILDFSSVTGSKDQVRVIEFDVNPGTTLDETLVINYVRVGPPELNGCGSDPEVGITDIDTKDESIKVYPNPVHTEKVYFSDKLTNVSVYDALGNKMMSAKEADDLNISNLRTGVYFIQSIEGAFKFVVE